MYDTPYTHLKEGYYNVSFIRQSTCGKLLMRTRIDFCIQRRFNTFRLEHSINLLETSLIGKALDFGPR